MSETRTRDLAAGLRRDNDDLFQLVLGGLWPAEGGLEALLDRIEAREARQ